MDMGILTAILSFIGTLCGSLSSVFVSAKLTNYRLKNLENDVTEIKSLVNHIPVIEERINVANHRITDLEKIEERSYSYKWNFLKKILLKEH